MNEPHAHRDIPPEGLVMNHLGDRLYGPEPKVKPPTRITVSGTDLRPRLYESHSNPRRFLNVELRHWGQAIFILILVWLVGIVFITTFGGVK